MWRKYKTKVIVSGLVAVALFLGFALLVQEVNKSKSTGPVLVNIGSLIVGFIKKEGHFPASEAELREKGYLKVIEEPTGTQYYVRSYAERDSRWRRLDNFPNFPLKYEAKVEDLTLIQGMLIDKDTEAEVLLIHGPYREKLMPTYRSISVTWYKILVGQPESGDTRAGRTNRSE